MTYTPEQLREEAQNCEQEVSDGNKPIILPEVFIGLARALADALEELAGVKKAISESCDEQRGEYFGCRRAERAEAALAERDAELARLRARLEIDFAVDGNGKRVPFPDGAPDGIACRDETIRLLEAELARLKAPVEGEIARVVFVVRRVVDLMYLPDRENDVLSKAASLIESLAARNEELFEQVAALTEERDWYSTANERAERAEAALADHERWLDEMVSDYRLDADPHTASKRLAINSLIHEQRTALAEAERKCERLKHHAEAMAKAHALSNYDYNGAFAAYRAEFKE